MTFGKQSGPPASHRQVEELLELLKKAGHSDFRDARGPMGFSQRQAGGKFSRDEAQQFIDQLEEAEDQRIASAAPKLAIVRPAKTVAALRDIPTEELSAELQRRGFRVTKG